ncbi:PadR family transcriptional regulator [Bifidobacterium crudilactis]|jgi:DNA-binding PadR family transcriptional regulator|uniref:PadR family transcriptional regulator n=1 Tax=Bifidobacterium crudilactis TaxID=327277 RepID=UPI002355E56E|nr:PadR family transcriptional regulator [Bifidobacterium crudilactis]MCI1217526.1 PadR family transcriptional regulator [Bifidobacterium crudilactis]
MATIDLIVLGMLKKEPLSAYDIQKLVEYRNISRWVKISTPSIYKKTIQLESKGLIKATVARRGKRPEKAVYSLTAAGEAEFDRLMTEIAHKPISIFLDFNAVIVNLDNLSQAARQSCITGIKDGVTTLRTYLQDNLDIKEHDPEVPTTGMAVLRQQLLLANAIEDWITSLETDF